MLVQPFESASDLLRADVLRQQDVDDLACKMSQLKESPLFSVATCRNVQAYPIYNHDQVAHYIGGESPQQ
jgi:hypothetical protein